MKQIKRILEFILDLPVSILFNFYYLPKSKAIKMPILVSHNIKIKNMGSRNSLIIGDVKFKSIEIGRDGSFALGIKDKVYWDIDKDAKVNIKGTLRIGRGTQIICGEKAEIIFGKNFYCNAQCIINSNGKIHFGDETIIGWKTEILTDGGHKINKINKENKGNIIKIGKHVWIASNVTILNGADIKDNCIIATKSCINKNFEQSNIMIGKYNTILKENVMWEK